LASLPGVRAAGATSALPIPERIGGTTGKFIVVDRAPPSAGEEPGAHVTIASDGLFDVLRIPLRSGRLFTRTDDALHPQVALVNEALARKYWPNENPVGKRIQLRFAGPPVEREIVGIVGDVRESGLDLAPQPAVFVPHAQSPTGSLTLVVRTVGDPAESLPALRATLASLNAELPIASSATLDALLADTLKLRRFNLLLLSTFSLTALILAVVGVYGLIAQAASERTREIGVRIALGAGGRDVLALVMRQGVAPALVGIGGGVLASLALTRVLRGMLYAITPLDATTFLAVPTLMLATAVVACWLPAWRATRVDPLLALRGD
jgi:predicted permease